MSCLKRPLDDQDPDYEDSIPHETKRLRILEENAKLELSHRVGSIVQREFGGELAQREKEVLEIQERLQQAQKSLHMLRYVVVSSFYNKKQGGSEEKQKPIHPAVKKLIGKEPKSWEPLNQRPSKYRATQGNSTVVEVTPQEIEPVCKVPRYIPPKSSPRTGVLPTSNPRRGMRHKVKKRIVIGNISKWVPVDTREDAASHKWMMYVRGPKESPDVSGFVSKVRFFLHPSYRPHDIAEVTSPPFHLSRRGWGEFPVRVQIHFTQPRNKPVDLIHHLKLDRTYTGLQTLGAETVVDIWLHSGEESATSKPEETVTSISEELTPLNIEQTTTPNNNEKETPLHNFLEPSELASRDIKVEVEDNNDAIMSTSSTTSNKETPLQNFLEPPELASKEIKVEVEDNNDVIMSTNTSNVNSEEEMMWPLNDSNIGAVEEVVPSVKIDDDTSETEVQAESSNKMETIEVTTMNSITPSLDHDYVAAPTPTAKLTTLVKCMDKNGRVFYLTLGAKPPMQSKVVPEQTSLLRRKLVPPKPENGNNQSVLIVKNGQLYLLKHPQTSVALRSVLKRPEEPRPRALVLNKQNSRQVSMTNRVRYEDSLAAVIAKCKFPDVALSVRWLLRHMPLVTAKAKDPEFRVVHPYAAPDVATFMQWNIGRQRAAEWLRAKAVHKALCSYFSEDQVWGVRAIQVWSRMHGYCPVQPAGEGISMLPSSKTSTYTEPVGVMDWLVNAQTADAGDDSDIEIDVISTQQSPAQIPIKQELPETSHVEMLETESVSEPLCLFARETARELGVKLEPQELAPGIMYCAAERMLAEAVQLLADDLVRRSMCRAWIRNGNRPPDCIQVEDVRAAILTRPELDILSNRGLGVQITDTS